MLQNGQDRGERSRRTFTIEDYREALRVVDARRAEAPGLRVQLAAAVTEAAPFELPRLQSPAAPGRAVPAGGGPAPRRATIVGQAAVVPPPSEPVTAAVLRAVGLGVRPSGRDR
jgi:hypothetical protein